MAVDCNITLNGIPCDCTLNRGGISQVWISPRNPITTQTVTDGVLTALEAPDWHEYCVRPFESNFSSAFQNDNGIQSVETTITLSISKLTVDKNEELNSLLIGGFVVAVKDNNGEYWYFGYDETVWVGASTADTGTARTDFNGYTLVLTDYSRQLPYGMAAAVRPDATPANP